MTLLTGHVTGHWSVDRPVWSASLDVHTQLDCLESCCWRPMGWMTSSGHVTTSAMPRRRLQTRICICCEKTVTTSQSSGLWPTWKPQQNAAINTTHVVKLGTQYPSIQWILNGQHYNTALLYFLILYFIILILALYYLPVYIYKLEKFKKKPLLP